MKKFLSVLVVLSLAFTMFVLPSFAEDDNLLSDPTVDNDLIVVEWPNGWAAGIAQEWSDESHTDDGSGSVVLQNDTDHSNQHCTTPVTLTGGVTYKLSGWIKYGADYHCNCAGACGGYIAINTPNAAGAPSGNYPARAGYVDTNDVVTGEWIYFETEYTPEEDVNTYVSLCLWGSQGTVYFDEIYIGEAGSPYYTPETGDTLSFVILSVVVALAAVVVERKKASER